MRNWLIYRRLASLMAVSTLFFQGCSDGHFNFLGYTSAPNYNTGIRTVYLSIPGNVTYRRGLEFDLKRALDREIALKTPYKSIGYRDGADTELIVKIISRTKSLVNFNQLGEVREAEMILTAEVTWLDRRPGHTDEVLSKPAVEGPTPPAKPLPPADPLAPLPKPLPVIVTATASYHPELGGSTVSCEQQLIARMAVQIVSMMEKPW
jgi:hypothetical protein